MMTYGSVCSGIEAASVAWDPLGWTPAWFSQFDPEHNYKNGPDFPSAVLAHHWPEVLNLGDMTQIATRIATGEIDAPDLLVGGTPCQAFSVAGLRNGLNDSRGQLTLKYVELANAIDYQRAGAGKSASVIVWENVPGVLSSKDNAFGSFLAGLAGADEAIEPGPRPEPGKSSPYWRWDKKTGEHVSKWPKSGCVYGRQRKLAWRILDAQHFGVAQRRRRVFVVASARNDFDPAKILFEFDGVRRNSPPSREPRQAVAALTANGVGTCGADDNQAQAGHLITAFGGGNRSGEIDIAACLTAKGQRNDFEVETFAVQAATGDISHALTAEGFDASEDGTGRGTPVVAYSSNGHASFAEGFGPLRAKPGADHENLAVMAFQPGNLTRAAGAAPSEKVFPTLKSDHGRGMSDQFPHVAYAVHGTQDPDTLSNLAHTLGRNHGQENAVLAFSSKDYGGDVSVDVSPTLRAGGHAESHANSGAPPAVVYALQDTTGRDKAQNGKGWSDEGTSYTVDTTGTQDVALSVALRGREGGATAELGDDVAGCLRASTGGGDKPHVLAPAIPVQLDAGFAFAQNSRDEVRMQGRDGLISGALSAEPGMKQTTYWCGTDLAVRRLTPTECERLQGFPDGHTDIPWKNKDTGETPDGPRYKAIGNSMAVPVMQWIGQRIGKYHEETQISGDNAGNGKNTDVSGRSDSNSGIHHVSADRSVRNKPFFKWAGGKFSVIDDILRHLPTGKRLIEPFAGGGSVFLNAGFDRALVNDINPDLILTYRMLKQEAHSLITQAHCMFQDYNTPDGYEHVLNCFNERKYTDFDRAAAFIFLNRHCYSGLTRYNLKGIFNVGYGKYKKPYFPLEEMEGFLSMSDRLEFSCANFADVIAQAGEGDVIFCDPPYEPKPGTNGFTAYFGGSFRFDKQVELAKCIKAASLRGAKAVITNSGVANIVQLYQSEGFEIRTLFARRSISCVGDTRETAEDIIALVNCSKKI